MIYRAPSHIAAGALFHRLGCLTPTTSHQTDRRTPESEELSENAKTRSQNDRELTTQARYSSVFLQGTRKTRQLSKLRTRQRPAALGERYTGTPAGLLSPFSTHLPNKCQQGLPRRTGREGAHGKFGDTDELLNRNMREDGTGTVSVQRRPADPPKRAPQKCL
ncbi:hypothetical protein SRHO_G00129750 [Serrasalmus rhombeus]